MRLDHPINSLIYVNGCADNSIGLPTTRPRTVVLGRVVGGPSCLSFMLTY